MAKNHLRCVFAGNGPYSCPTFGVSGARKQAGQTKSALQDFEYSGWGTLPAKQVGTCAVCRQLAPSQGNRGSCPVRNAAQLLQACPRQANLGHGIPERSAMAPAVRSCQQVPMSEKWAGSALATDDRAATTYGLNKNL